MSSSLDEHFRLRRQHRRADGAVKVSYFSEEGARQAVREMRAKHHGVFFTYYLCPVCSSRHLAHDTEARNRWWEVMRMELGNRAAANLGLENSGETQTRVGRIVARGRKWR